MDLATLSFKVNTEEIKDAKTQLDSLAGALKNVNGDKLVGELKGVSTSAEKASNELDKAAKGTKGIKDAAEDTAPAISKVSKLIQHQSDILKFLRNDQKYIEDGFTKSQASLMATAQAAGASSSELQVLANVFKDISKITGKNPFDQSASGLGQLKQKALEMANVSDYLSKGLSLTAEQVRLLTRDQLRLVDSMKQQGLSNSDIMAALDKLESEYLQVASSVNAYVAASKELERQNKIQNKQLTEQLTMMDTAVAQFRKLEEEKAAAAARASQKIIDSNQAAIQSAERLSQISKLMQGGMTQSEASKRVDLASSGVELANIEKLIAAEKQLTAVKEQMSSASSNQSSSMNESAKAAQWLEREIARANNAISDLNENLKISASNRLFKFEEQLRKAGISGEEAQRMMHDYRNTIVRGQIKTNEMMDKELRNLARAVSVQMGDVAVSLASGMNPFMVMIQQGDQLRAAFQQVEGSAVDVQKSMQTAAAMIAKSFLDTGKAIGSFFIGTFKSLMGVVSDFGSALAGPLGGNAIKAWRTELELAVASGGKVSTAVTIMNAALATLTVSVSAVIVAFTAFAAAAVVAWYKVQKQTDEMTKSLIINGGSLGMNRDAALDLAKSFNAVGVSTSGAVDLITAFTKEGGFLKSQLETLIPVGKKMQEQLGMSADDVAKKFSKFNEDPVKALAELGKATGMVSIETFNMVSELKKSGDTAGATALAIKTAAEVHTAAADRMKAEYSTLGRIINETGNMFNKFWSGVKGLMYQDSATDAMAKQIETLKKRLEDQQKSLRGGKDANGNDTQYVKNIKEQIAYLSKRLSLQMDANQADEIQRATNAKNLKDADEVAKINKKLEDDLDKINEKYLSRNQYIDYYLKKMKEDIGQSKYDQIKIENAKKLAGALWDQANARKASLGSTSDTALGNLQKQYNSELNLAASLGKDKLSILEVYYKLGLKSESEYLNEQVSLVRASEAEQLKVVEKFEKDIADAKLAQINKIETERAKALSSAKGNTSDKRDINEAADKEIAKTIEAYATLGKTVEDTKAKIKSGADARAMKAYDELGKQIKIVTDAYDQLKLSLNTADDKRRLQLEEERELLGIYGAEAVAIKARNSSLESSVSTIEKMKAALAKEEEILKSIKEDSTSDPQALIAAEAAVAKSRAMLSQATTDAEVAARKAGIDAVLQYELEERKKLQEGISDAIVTALFEGGQAGKKKLRDLIVAELKKPVTMVINAAVNATVSSLIGSATGSAGGSAIGSSIGSIAVGGTTLSAVGGSISTGFSAGIAGTDLSAAIAAYESAGMTGVSTGLAAGQALGAAVPYIAAAMALYSIYKSLDDSGTPHTGASASYSTATGSVTGQGLYGVGSKEGYYSKDVEATMVTMSKSIVSILDQTAINFGKSAGYEAATAFADDSSKDGSWGSLLITKLGETVASFGADGNGKWPGKSFSDGSAGITEYTQEVAANIKTALDSIGLPEWAQSMLDNLGDAPTIDELSTVIDRINATQDAIESLGAVMPEFSNLTSEAVSSLLNSFGSIENLSSYAASYYQNFYSESEKVKATTDQLKKSFDELGIAMPVDRLQYRTEIEKAMAAGNEELAAKLIMLSGSFASISEELTGSSGMTDTLKSLKDEYAQLQIELLKLNGDTAAATAATRALAIEGMSAIEIAAYDANAALQAQIDEITVRKDLEKQLLTAQGNTTALRELELAAMTPANRELQQLVWQTEAAAEAAKTAAAAEKELVDQRASLEDQLFQLVSTTAQQRQATLNKLNDAESQRLQQQIWDAQDKASLDKQAYDLETQKLTLLGDTNTLRQRELALMDPSLRAAQQEIWAIEDQQKANEAAAAAAAEAAAASEKLKEAWQSITDTIFEEVARIRGLVNGNSEQGLAAAQSAFDTATAKALSGDQEAAKELPKLSQTLLDIAGEQARSLVELRRIQMLTAASLESTGTTISSKYGLTIPAFADGGNYSGGVALVGEQGPELINFNSSGYVTNAKKTAGALDNSRLEDLVEKLNENIDGLRYEVRANVSHTSKIAKILSRVNQDGDSLTVKFDTAQPVNVV